MDSFSDPAGRRFLIGLIGSFIFFALDVGLYLLKLPGYFLLFCVALAYVTWVCLRYLKERAQPSDFAPWYESRTKAALFGAIMSAFMGIFALIRHSDDYQSCFFWGGVFFIMAVVSHYLEKRPRSPEDTD